MNPATLAARLAMGWLITSIALAQQPLPPEQVPGAVSALTAWLESEHGDPAELAPVLRYGEVMIPSLGAAVARGPSAARRERLRRALQQSHARLGSRAAETSSPAPPREKYVEHYLQSFDAVYRLRAAQALAALGSVEARQAIEQALGLVQRDDVRRMLEETLKALK